MQLGIFAKTFAAPAFASQGGGMDPARVFSAVAAAGFSVSQYNMACSGLAAMPDAIPGSVANAVAEAAKAAGVGIAAVSGTYNMIHPDPAVRARGQARLAVLASAASGLSTGLITLCTGTRDAEDPWRAHPGNDAPEAWRDLLDAMEIAAGIADRHGVDLGIEPELGNVVNSALKAKRLIEEIGSARLKIVLDPANLFETASLAAQRDIVSAAIDLLAGRIVMGHAKDRDEAGGFVAAGRGVLDYAHYLACLRRAGFDGPLVAHGLEATDATGVAGFLRRALGEAGVAVAGAVRQ